MYGANRRHEAKTIGRRYFASSPNPRKGNNALGINKPSICQGKCLCANVILLNPVKTAASKCGNTSSNERFEADVAGFSEKHRANADR